MKTMKKGDPIKVVRGSYAGLKGTFVEVASAHSYRVIVDGEKRTLRKTSIEPDKSAKELLKEIETMRKALERLEMKLKSLN